MVFTSDTSAIMSEINPVLKAMYAYYFQSELNAAQDKYSQVDLVVASLESSLSFAKDFELCPYLVNRKVCYYIWHAV